MKKDQVHVGHTYVAKISDKLTRVRIDGANAHGGWDATNLGTNKKVRIKSPAKLRGPAPDGEAKQRAKAVAETQAADAAANAHAVKPDAKRTKTTTVNAGGGIMVDVVEPNATTPAKATKAKKAPKEPKVKTSGLDAAAQVLKNTGEPMTCKAIVETMLAKGMWKTSGKTPSATIYSAMLREIDGKPGESRFTKTGRGLFALAAPKA